MGLELKSELIFLRSRDVPKNKGYRRKGIPTGKKSVTLSVRFRDEDGTLTHETVDRYQADIVKSLAASVGAELRTV